MRSSGTRLIIGGMGLMMLSGCAGLGKDTLVFGTDTKVAFDVSADPAGHPSFTLGYKRREMIWLPLSSGDASPPTHLCIADTPGKLLCAPVGDDPSKGTHVCVASTLTAAQAAARDTTGAPLLCSSASDVRSYLYKGTASNNDSDAYSVMASFGLDTYGGTGGAKIAQFIATGIAARNLTSKNVDALINPNAAASPVSDAMIDQAFMNQGTRADRVAKAMMVNGVADAEKLKQLAAASKLNDDAKTKLLSVAGKDTAAVKACLLHYFQSDLEGMDLFISKGGIN